MSLKAGVPVLFGVLTTETIEQAIEHAGTKVGDKGFDYTIGAIEMVNLLRQLDGVQACVQIEENTVYRFTPYTVFSVLIHCPSLSFRGEMLCSFHRISEKCRLRENAAGTFDSERETLT